jgi:hypothetical protein
LEESDRSSARAPEFSISRHFPSIRE